MPLLLLLADHYDKPKECRHSYESQKINNIQKWLALPVNVNNSAISFRPTSDVFF